MRTCVLSAIFMILIYNCASATVKEDKLVTTHQDPGDTFLKFPIGPVLPRHDDIIADDQPEHHPDNHGHMKFEESTKSLPDFKKKHNKDHSDGDKKYTGFNKFNQHDRILTTGVHFEGDNLDHTSNFHELQSSHRAPKNFDSEDDNTEPNNGNGQAIQENDEKFEEYDFELDNIQNEEVNTKNLDTQEKIEIPKVVSKQKRRPTGRPTLNSVLKNTAIMSPNAVYPGLSNPDYLQYREPDNQTPGAPNSYGYLPSGYPTYPTTNPTSPYPTPGYSGYGPYQLSYPGSYPGYPTYPSYQVPPKTRSQAYPVGYPDQSDQITQIDTKHRTGDYSGSSPSPHRVSGRPVEEKYPGQEHGGYGFASDPNSQYGQYGLYTGYQGYYDPFRHPKTLTQRAVSTVAEALTSIALFDDKQCVPRLLCEVASGSAASSPTLQKATAGLTPLLTVLESYNGTSSSPLFLFGRAAVLGVTTKGNPTACKYAYSKCPKDPEGLMHYLNNHNGGFFRFFGQPEGSKQPQDLEQFYNHLSGQNGNAQQQANQQPIHQQPLGAYANSYHQSNGVNYHHKQNPNRNSKDIDSEISLYKIEERIQNKPGIEIEDDGEKEQDSTWTFPDEVNQKKQEDKPRRVRKQRAKNPKASERPTRGERGGSKLKFPDDRGPAEDQPDFDRHKEFIRTQKGIYFPNQNHFNFQTNYDYQTTPVNLAEYEFDYKHNFYVKRTKPNTNTASKDEGDIVYIVRGNGDPNHPEIVKVRPGQRL